MQLPQVRDRNLSASALYLASDETLKKDGAELALTRAQYVGPMWDIYGLKNGALYEIYLWFHIDTK